jgi:RsiW-degrading membrane proteinase PrsW (M82 family)
MFLFAVILVFLAIASGFAWYLIKHDRGEREPISALWIAFAFGLFGVVIASFLEYYLLPIDPETEGIALSTIGWIALCVGFIEELAKCLPLMFYIYRKRYFNEHTDGVIYFALAGLGFGLPENILYTFQFGASTGLMRVIVTPLFHAATTGIVGYMLAKSKISHTSKMWVILAVIAVALIHGFYDFGLLSGVVPLVLLALAVTVALTVNLFALYLRARHLDEKMGLSVVGHNTFCRSCGAPNPKHNLYCSSCGNRA